MSTSSELSTESTKRLASAHLDLRRLVSEVEKVFPLTVLEAYRDESAQNAAFASGHSKLPYPQSKHNHIPSLAIDMTPVPYDPSNTPKLYYFAGYVVAAAKNMGIKVRWGGDFNENLDPKDDKFKDLFHFELADS